MKKIAAIFICVLLLSGFVSARISLFDTIEDDTQQQKKKSTVEYEADVMKQVGDTIVRFVGNVVFHHNGAIIQCDSAFRYNNRKFDCFGNVIINQDSTYIYGDKVVYDEDLNRAQVFAPLIKLTNGAQTVMYTYFLIFDTKTKVGEYWGGGVVTNRDNVMESHFGTFYSETNDVKLSGSVSMRSVDYRVKTDSLKFNLDTEITTFLARTYIWDNQEDFITSQSGRYDNRVRTYTFTDNAYIMTKEQESWADSIIYVSSTREAFMQGNIQLLDTAQKTLAFGDWGYHSDSTKLTILAARPSIRSWEEKGDTAFMRADSIYIETLPLGSSKPGVSKRVKRKHNTDTTQLTTNNLSAPDSLNTLIADSTSTQDSLQISPAVLERRDTFPQDNLPKVEAVPDSLNQQNADTTDRRIRAFANVMIYRKDVQAACDSLVSYTIDSSMTMFVKPVLWSGDNQITAEQIDAYITNEELDWADFTGNPIVAQRVDSTRFNQAKGKMLKTLFRNNELYHSILSGNVLNYYYFEEGTEVVSFDKLEGAELDITYDDREPEIMKWIGSSEWVMYPIDAIPADQQQLLEGFEWRTEGRATSGAQVSDRVVRASQRALYSGIKKPTFPIEEQINDYKKKLLESGEWYDRTDLPTRTADYFKEQQQSGEWEKMNKKTDVP